MAGVTILGGGAFGTAVATLLANNGHNVSLWCLEPDVVESINTNRSNHYLPGIQLPKNITATSDLSSALRAHPIIFEAIPVAFLRSTLQDAARHAPTEATWVLLSKGIEQKTFLFPSQIINDLVGNNTTTVAVSGPNFAQELAQGRASAATVASTNEKAAQDVAKLLASNTFKPYLSGDPIGTQVGGALKNVITLAIGMLLGAEYAENTRAFVFTAGLNELGLLAKKCGGRQESIFELCGVGDLVLTSMGSQSRNLRCGQLFGRGMSLEEIKKDLSVLPEGVNTVQSVHQLMQKYDLNLPICAGVYNVLFNSSTVSQFVESIMKWDGEWCYSY